MASDLEGLGAQVKEKLGGHNSFNDIYSSVFCHVSDMQKMSKSLSVMTLFRIKDLFAIERAFNRANLMGLGCGCGADLG